MSLAHKQEKHNAFIEKTTRTSHKAGGLMKSWAAAAKALGGVMGVKVKFGGSQPCTDGSTIFVPRFPYDLEPAMVNMVKAFIVHEAAHVRFTSFAEGRSFAMKHGPMAARLNNAVEDVYIEKSMGKVYRGTESILRNGLSSVIEMGWWDTSEDSSWAFIGFVLLWGRYHVVKQVPVLTKLEEARAHLVNLISEENVVRVEKVLERRLPVAKSTADNCETTAELLALLEEMKEEAGEQQSQAGNGSSQGEEGQSSDSSGDSSGNSESNSDSDDNDGDEQSSDSPASGDQSEDEGEDAQSSSSDSEEEGDDSNTQSSGTSDSTDSESGDSDSVANNIEDILDGDSMDQSREEVIEWDKLIESVAEEKGIKPKTSRGAGAPADTTGAEVKLATVDHDYYHDLHEDIGAHAASVRKRLVAAVMARKKARWNSTEEGRLDTRKLASVVLGNERVFKKRSDRPLPNSAISVGVDASGSMGDGRSSPLWIAQQGMSLLAEAANTLNIPLELWGFGAWGDGFNELDTIMVKEFNAPYNQVTKGRIGGFNRAAGGTTPMGECLMDAAFRLAEVEKVERKLMFLLTDGCSNDQELTADSIARLESEGVIVVVIGIATDEDVVSEISSRYAVASQPEDLVDAILMGVQQAILN